jgi:SAM-dependent methyltransferase
MNNPPYDAETIRTTVRQRYGTIAKSNSPLAGDSCGCCDAKEQSLSIGYTPAEISAVPEGANLGLGCGNPVALASLHPGQTVLDLGAGAGFDAFLAARAVGPSGRVIGVDMTPEMVARARANAKRGGYAQVQFRLGEIEALPVADSSIDVILSNCVINLCPDKRPVYEEAFRVLKPGGRIAVSDVVARAKLPETLKNDLALHSSCLAGAPVEAELKSLLEEAGFSEIAIRERTHSTAVTSVCESEQGSEPEVFAAEVTATKPATPCCGPSCCSRP